MSGVNVVRRVRQAAAEAVLLLSGCPEDEVAEEAANELTTALIGLQNIDELIAALTAERAMEASGERPSIDVERAVYDRTDAALARCKGAQP